MNATIARLIAWETESPRRSWTIASTNGQLTLTMREDGERLMEQSRTLGRAEMEDAKIDLFDAFAEQSIRQFSGFSGRKP
jgi:hypothetical protein